MNKTDTLVLPLEYISTIFDPDRYTTFSLYRYTLSAMDGLPPYSQAKVIDMLSIKLARTKSRVCLWVSVNTPSKWYVSEIERIIRYHIPTIVLPADGDKPTQFGQFRTNVYRTYPPRGGQFSLCAPNKIGDDELKGSLLSAIRVLARMDTAHTIEIASMTGFSKTHTRGLLKKLQQKKMIRWERIGKYDGWKITNTGLRAAHRSWNVPKGAHFAQFRKEYRYAGERHRRTARLWRLWLETAYKAEIWACWTEVPVQRGIPDALAWGRVNGVECVFWLEVDTGHSSKEVMQKRYFHRLRQVRRHSAEWGLPIVFCIMGPPWVVEYFPNCIRLAHPGVAIIGHDWRDFGNLPSFIIGDWRDDLNKSWQKRAYRPPTELPFDPEKYPAKPSAKPKPVSPKTARRPRQKLKKQPYANWNNDFDWNRDYHEE